jgi:hypothetical protein
MPVRVAFSWRCAKSRPPTENTTTVPPAAARDRSAAPGVSGVSGVAAGLHRSIMSANGADAGALPGCITGPR